jgi:hypothetical protein
MTVHVQTRRRREKRTEEISFKVSRDEKDLIAAAAKSKNTKVATLIRKIIFEYGIEVEVPEEEPKAPERPAPEVNRELMLEPTCQLGDQAQNRGRCSACGVHARCIRPNVWRVGLRTPNV